MRIRATTIPILLLCSMSTTEPSLCRAVEQSDEADSTMGPFFSSFFSLAANRGHPILLSRTARADSDGKMAIVGHRAAFS